ncbi:hypothetical protein EWM64_g6311 [Hericium alpestre]|uniref:Uncharacterized protein n=1 Tax=Hericium alpestre TaxID=135208 RepID=A0A4Y9ZW12_9AGAM|nr:hypothetical protein EWM64_g6311 [Hericium alpestre]
MFVQSTYLFLSRPRIRQPLVRNFYIAFGATLLVAMTLNVVSTLLIGDLMWIDHRDVPGGPLAYYTNHLSSWLETLASAASSFANLSGDALLIYRSYMIWGRKLWVLALPVPLLLTNTAIAVAVNISVTILISARLLVMRQRARSMMNSQSARIYTSVVAIFVGSVAPVFSRMLNAFCCLSPQLIILRISLGLGWSRNTELELGLETHPAVVEDSGIDCESDSVLREKESREALTV